MKNDHVDLLLLSTPTLASAVPCMVASMDALRSLLAAKARDPLLTVLGCREHVNTIISVTTNVMFVGPAVGVLYGAKRGFTVCCAGSGGCEQALK